MELDAIKESSLIRFSRALIAFAFALLLAAAISPTDSLAGARLGELIRSGPSEAKIGVGWNRPNHSGPGLGETRS